MAQRLLIILILTTLTACSLSTSTSSQSVRGNYSHTILLPKKLAIPKEFYSRDLSIVAIGDSLTEGVGDITKLGGYTSFLEKLLVERREVNSVSITNFGVKGDRTENLLARLEKDISTETLSSADMIIITIGGNDMVKVVRENFLDLSFESFESEQRQYKKKLEKIIELIQKENKESKIFLVGLYNPFLAIGELSTEIDKIIYNWNNTSKSVLLQYENTVFVPVDDLFMESNERLLYTDEFHPNTRGYELIGKRIAEAIK